MDAGLFIYFPRDQNIYIRVFDGQDICFKKLPAHSPPPPSESTVRPLTKKGPVSTIPNSTDCHTKHIAHGLWPSVTGYCRLITM